jgi:putative heme-binding domain-containing protein
LTEPVRPPTVFLDKSPRIVWYQLNRLSNERLLLVERDTSDPKYRPVYEAILTRAGMSRQHRQESLQALIELQPSDVVTELLSGLARLDPGDREEQRVGRELAALLTASPAEVLHSQEGALAEAASAESPLVRAAAYAALIAAGRSSTARELAGDDPAALVDFLAAAPLVPVPEDRAALRELIVPLLGKDRPEEVRRAAVQALAVVPAGQAESFRMAAGLLVEPAYRAAAVGTLLQIPGQYRDSRTAAAAVAALVSYAESTPAGQRTSTEFLDAMQLVDQLLPLLDVGEARRCRDRLRAVTVRVVRIHTIPEQMQYDLPYFAVEAGRPVQVILQNDDLMPHNLVITVPGAIKDVALLAATMPPQQSAGSGKQYVPDVEQVLHATDLVPAGQYEILTFTAPAEPGEYPYVCTFPGHWMRMNGVMVVVSDLDAWLQDPQAPADPLGNTRPLVKNWTVEDLRDSMQSVPHGDSLSNGARIFQEATCVQCHKLHGQGGAVGPELTDVFTRWKGDRLGVLREMLEPSHRIDPQYAVHSFILADGRVLSGLIKAEDKKTISVLENPEIPQPIQVQRSDIEETVRSSHSMMPKGLLDRFTRDEIIELLSYLEQAAGGRPVEHH